MNHILLSCLACFISACASTSPHVTVSPPFLPTVERHLAAVEGRDIDVFIDTITRTDALRVIFPNGAAVNSTSEVIAFHREWFADPHWRWHGEIVDAQLGTDLSLALVKYSYRDTPDAEPHSSWLALVFALEEGQWRLVHDQNTSLPAPE